MRATPDQKATLPDSEQEINRIYLLEEIELFFAGKRTEEELYYAIKAVKPAKEEEEC